MPDSTYRHSVRIYIPDPYGHGKPWVDEACRSFAEWFGGATTVTGHGSYLSTAGAVLTTPVTVVEAIETRPGQMGTYGPAIERLATEIKADLSQEYVLVAYSYVTSVLV